MFNAREEVLKMKEELKVVENEQQSFAMELVHTLKLQNEALKLFNKRMFILCLVIFIAFCSLLGYTIWLYNDITVDTQEISIEDVETIDSSTIKIGDELWEKLE